MIGTTICTFAASFSMILAQADAPSAPAPTAPAVPAAPGAPQGETAEPQAPPSPFGSLWVMVLLFVLMYFLLIRPQRLRQKKLQEQIAAMKKGDRVITAGGIHGLVENVKDKTVILRVAENVRLEFELASVGRIIKKGESDPGAS